MHFVNRLAPTIQTSKRRPVRRRRRPVWAWLRRHIRASTEAQERAGTGSSTRWNWEAIDLYPLSLHAGNSRDYPSSRLQPLFKIFTHALIFFVLDDVIFCKWVYEYGPSLNSGSLNSNHGPTHFLDILRDVTCAAGALS